MDNIILKNKSATAIVSPFGGQILSFKPIGGKELLFQNSKAVFNQQKAIRAGVPICWPWFGSRDGKPSHGIARTSRWKLEEMKRESEDLTVVKLELINDDVNFNLFPYAYDLSIEYHIGASLTIKLITGNKDDKAFTFTEALHTYFSIEDINQMKINGLQNVAYYDKVNEDHDMQIEQSLQITTEIDRVYETTNQVRLKSDDIELTISGSGYQNIVIWNPGESSAEQIADLDDYRKFVCIETANVGDNAISLLPGAKHTMTKTIKIN